MKYLAIDIETTGLNPMNCQVLEIACVLADTADLETDADSLPLFVRRLYYDKIVGEPVALAMNARILADMNDRRGHISWLHPDSLWSTLDSWIENQVGPTKISVSGKNYATFDKLFLERLPRWNASRFHRRIIDCGQWWMDPITDEFVPDTKECVRRAGIETDLGALHTAIFDARLVVELNRAAFRRGCAWKSSKLLEPKPNG
jgi:oligoribonuclease (3'-5' exoribonuclease)